MVTLLAAIGMLCCRLAVVSPEDEPPLQPALQRALGLALVFATLAAFGILLSRTLEFNDGSWSRVWPDMRLAITVTHFGHIWLWRIPALALAWLAWRWGTRQQTAAAWLILLAVAMLALTRSETGHPADHGDFALAVWMDWVHLMAAGAWVGSLFGMSLVVYPHLLRAGPATLGASARIFQRLSTLSGAALAALLAAGIYNAVTQLGSVAALWNTRYGIILDIKLAIVLAMVTIGAHNRYRKLPLLLQAAARADDQPAPGHEEATTTPLAESGHGILRACARAVMLESLLGLAVIGATATLLHAMPPADASHELRAAPSPMPNGP